MGQAKEAKEAKRMCVKEAKRMCVVGMKVKGLDVKEVECDGVECDKGLDLTFDLYRNYSSNVNLALSCLIHITVTLLGRSFK
jgi:hypothetical protein